MAQILGLPKLSPTMEEGVLVRWTKKEGDKVSPGDLIAEAETDKANMDFNIKNEEVLLKFLVQAGETVKLGAPVAIIGKAGEDTSALEQQAKSGGGGGAAPATAPPKTADKVSDKDEGKEKPAPKQSAASPAPAAKPASEAKPAPAPAPKTPTPTQGNGKLLA